jgi:hypothetical protein
MQFFKLFWKENWIFQEFLTFHLQLIHSIFLQRWRKFVKTNIVISFRIKTFLNNIFLRIFLFSLVNSNHNIIQSYVHLLEVKEIFLPSSYVSTRKLTRPKAVFRQTLKLTFHSYNFFFHFSTSRRVGFSTWDISTINFFYVFELV